MVAAVEDRSHFGQSPYSAARQVADCLPLSVCRPKGWGVKVTTLITRSAYYREQFQILAGGTITVLAIVGCASHASPVPSASSAVAASPVAQKPVFPPKTMADFRAFAATGDASQVHQLTTSTQGSGSCPSRNVYVMVSQKLAGRALEADLSAFFVQTGLVSGQCQAFVFADHSRSDYRSHLNDGFTAGRVALTNSGSGSQRNLEVDTGEVTAENYDQQSEFDFSF